MAKRRRGTNTGIPGLSFSWKRALGITRARQQFARKTGIPTTKGGWQRKIGRAVTGGGCIVQIILAVSFISLLIAVIA